MIARRLALAVSLLSCFAIALLAIMFLWLSHAATVAASPADTQSGPLVLQLKLDREVAPILANYIVKGLADADRRKAALVLITMDTPGGLSDSMTEIVHAILDSPVPVAVYISPAGARGASAGFFILLSADVAAMAPGTRTGASTPIIMPGGGFSIPVDEVLRKKLNNDATAFLRSFAEKRGRNPELAQTAVTDARAFSEQEALQNHLIDLVAASNSELLEKLNGREISRFDGKHVKLVLDNYRLESFSLSGREEFLAWIVEPNVFFILLMVAVLGLYTEFTHPGAVAPGVFGGIAALLALYAAHLLPVNFVGVLLIVFAMVMFILEAKLSSHGVLLLGGVIAMLLGAVLLVRSPLTPGGVSIGVALAVTLPFAFIAVFLMRLVLKSRKWKSATGKEELLGEQGVVTSPVPAGGEGMIRVHGELWRAVANTQVPEGALVRVTRINGLTLVIEPVHAPAVSAG
jgi:membrane-bound serine protease (ClpP class)